MDRRLKPVVFACTAALVGWAPAPSARAFDLQFTITSQGSFTPNQLAILNQALVHVETMWETALTGYQPGINVASVPITIQPSFTGLASASYLSSSNQGGFTLATSGFININVLEIENFANWQGVGGPCPKPATNLNYIDELMAHETGHVLGIGTLWTTNGVYSTGTFQYTGARGLAAYKAEFDANATFVPVENHGNPGTPNSHWDQLMRSSEGEGTGDPATAYCLDPRVGVVDQYGRDRGLEMMSGAIDPDYLEPFISRTTVESMRDLGYAVAKFEDFNGDGAVNAADLGILNANFGATGLQIDSFTRGDVDRDRDVDGNDLVLWQRAFAGGGGATPIPEPAGLVLASVALLALRRARR